MYTDQILTDVAEYLNKNCGVSEATISSGPIDSFYKAENGGTQYFLFADQTIVEMSAGEPNAWSNGWPEGPSWDAIKSGAND